MLENKKVFVPYLGEGVHVSRLIASWLNAGKNIYEETFDDEGYPEYMFLVWLRALHVEERDITYIWDFATCGKIELELAVKKFRETHEVSDE